MVEGKSQGLKKRKRGPGKSNLVPFFRSGRQIDQADLRIAAAEATACLEKREKQVVAAGQPQQGDCHSFGGLAQARDGLVAGKRLAYVAKLVAVAPDG
jgi:hypothetical protein